MFASVLAKNILLVNTKLLIKLGNSTLVVGKNKISQKFKIIKKRYFC